MKTSEFRQILAQHPEAPLSFLLPDGGRIAAHAHITEVGRVEKTFIDCGGTIRKLAACNLQAWEADDIDHRFLAGKLDKVIDKAQSIIGADDPPVEIEYQDGLISQFPVLSGEYAGGVLEFSLGMKSTACLAEEVCIPNAESSECCGTTSGCS